MKMLCLLLASCIIMMAAGCTPSKSVQKKVLNYLQDKYGSNYDFEYVSHTQNKETNGRYEVTVRCKNDGLDFKIFVYSSVLITDSYSVDRANAAMEKNIREFLLSRDYSDSISRITWLNIFEDDATDYKFRTVPLTEHYSLSDAENIYRIEMADGLNPYQFVGGIYNFNSDLLASGVELKSASFAFNSFISASTAIRLFCASSSTSFSPASLVFLSNNRLFNSDLRMLICSSIVSYFCCLDWIDALF